MELWSRPNLRVGEHIDYVSYTDFASGVSWPYRRGAALHTTSHDQSQHANQVLQSYEEFDGFLRRLIGNRLASDGRPADRADICRLPRRPLDPANLQPEEVARCPICLEDIPLATDVTMLPCRHWFHHTCVELWLSQRDSCPLCRRSIKPESEE